MSAIHANLAHQSLLASNHAFSRCLLFKNTLSSFLKWYMQARTLPCDNHCTLVWSNIFVCSAPISSHKIANIQVFKSFVLTKLTILTTVLSREAISAGNILATSTYWCKKQCITTICFFS